MLILPQINVRNVTRLLIHGPQTNPVTHALERRVETALLVYQAHFSIKKTKLACTLVQMDGGVIYLQEPVKSVINTMQHTLQYSLVLLAQLALPMTV